MKKVAAYILTCFFLLSGCFSAVNAQTPWNLEKCIQYAWDNNIIIQQQELVSEQSLNRFSQSRLNFIPNLNARSSYSASWGRSVDLQTLQVIQNKLTQSINISGSANINLFEGLQKWNTLHYNESEYHAAQQDVKKLRNDIALEVARTYLQVLLAYEVLSVAENSIESVKEQIERTKKMVDAGNQSLTNLLDMESQLASEEVQLVTAKNQLINQYLTLRQLLDIAPDADFSISIPVINEEHIIFRNEDINNLYHQALGLPQIKKTELKLKSAEYSVAIAKGRYFPTLSLGASFGSFYSDTQPADFFEQIRLNRSPAISLALSVPIFTQGTLKYNKKNAVLGLRLAQLEVENSQKALYKEIQQATTEAAGAYNKYKATVQNVKAKEEAFRLTQQKFDVGMLSGTDYTVAKNNLFRAQSEEIQSKYQYIFTSKILDFYKGIPITL